jgi:hypothetical protein
MKRLMIAFAAVIALVGLVSPAQADVRRAILDSFQENPDLSTPGRGKLTLQIARNEQSIDFELSYQDLEGGNPTVAHIHFAKRGVNGNVVVFLCGGGGKPACPASLGTIEGTILPADVLGAQGIAAGGLVEFIEAIRRGATYVNVHNTLFPTGEIRGQIR